MIALSVNVNKVALLRNARGGNNPDLLRVAQDCVRWGAHGITVHPRPDERHIRKVDVSALKAALQVELNVEGYPSEDFLQMIEAVRPAQCTLVPDPPHVLTSSEGWDTLTHQSLLQDVVARLKASGVRVSLFIEPDERRIEYAARTGAHRVELYTGPYAAQYLTQPSAAVAPYLRAGQAARALGVGLNAGHDLDTQNLRYLAQHLPWLQEVSIGHALVCDALYWGLERTIAAYLACLKTA